jgi:hypothetical protein
MPKLLMYKVTTGLAGACEHDVTADHAKFILFNFFSIRTTRRAYEHRAALMLLVLTS